MNKKQKKTSKIGFIGCGKMARAIIKGMINSNFISSELISASEINEDLAVAKSKELGVKVICSNIEIAKNSDIIFLAVKPNIVRDVLEEIKSGLTEEKLVVSIAAGVKLETMENIVTNIPVIRVMPNAGLLVSEGMCCIAKGKSATDKDVEIVYDLLSKMGKCLILKEDKMDIVTAISGSGPAFFYKSIHEMALAGEKLGLDYKKSMILAAQTAVGSAKIMLKSDLHPQKLIDNISTKGGCTEVGVSVMNEADTEKLFFDVIHQTTKKATDLGKKK